MYVQVLSQNVVDPEIMSTDKVRVAVRVRPFNRRGMFTNKSAVVCIPCQKRVNYKPLCQAVVQLALHLQRA
jgi:hypothetical protein